MSGYDIHVIVRRKICMNIKRQHRIIICTLFLLFILGVLMPPKVQAYPGMSLTASAPTFAETSKSITVTGTTSTSAEIRIYKDGSLVASASDARSLSYSFTTSDNLRKYQIKFQAYAEVSGVIISRTVYRYIRTQFDDGSQASDYIRHPTSTAVWDAQYRMLNSLTINTENEWYEAIWNVLNSSSIAPHCGMTEWYPDTSLAADFNADGDFDGLGGLGWNCANYAGLISGMARSVGIESRLISMWYEIAKQEQKIGGGSEHMLVEVKIGSDWKFMSIYGDTTNHPEFRAYSGSSESVKKLHYKSLNAGDLGEEKEFKELSGTPNSSTSPGWREFPSYYQVVPTLTYYGIENLNTDKAQ